MPVFTRKQLRRDLAKNFIYDMSSQYPMDNSYTQVGQGSIVSVMNFNAVDLNATGQDLFQGAWIYVEGSAGLVDTAATMFQYIVGSYNCGSGAFITGQPAQRSLNTNGQFEIHTKVPPVAKDRAIDDTIQRVRLRQEVGISTIDGALFYDIDNCASPYTLDKILDVHVLANPGGSLDRDWRHVDDWQIATTGSGQELRLKYAIQGSQQLILDAVVIPTLGNEVSSISVPDERWVLSGAAMRCYDFLVQNAPGQQVSQLQQRRAEWAAEYTRLSARFQPTYESPIRYHEVVRGVSPQPWDTWG